MTDQDETRIVWIGIDPRPGTLYVVSARLRSYLGLARSGEYLHAIRPARLEDPTVGDGKLVVGELVCSCAAGSFGRRCYWTELAIALEHGDRGFVPPPAADPDPIPWLSDAAPGEIVEMFGR